MSSFEFIGFEVEDGVAVLSLNRPDALNSLTFEMMAEARDALQEVQIDRSIRALILTGQGKGFCAGQDLKNRIPTGMDVVDTLMERYFPVFKAIRTCRVPVIVAVNGVAAGGGASLALTGDIIIAAKSAKFIQVFSRIGLCPDLGSTYLLSRAIGRARALEMMMTNEPVRAERAAEIGMINKCVEDEDLMATARAMALKLASGPTYALEMTRKMVDDGEDEVFETRFRRELETNRILRDTRDSKEGVAAFLEKRSANFAGE
ncbi:crotonase [Alphaproteobacteria bacterium 46_93_T64]|nr:crotonase [Alphaproteobacteria bacterium 46_93_T64]